MPSNSKGVSVMASRRQVLATIAATATTPITTAVAVSTVAGCSGKPVARAKPVDRVTYLTGFGTTPREGYGWVADGMGFFAEVGIAASIQAGAPSDANLKTLAAGKAQFAVIDFVSAVRGVASWPDYRAVAAIQQTTLLSMITLPGRGITQGADLAGRTVGTGAAAASQTLFPTYARLAGFDASRTKIVNFAPDQLPAALIGGNIDAMGAYVVDIPAIAHASGKQPVVLPYSRYLTDLYGSVLITTTALIRANPDLVRRFGSALLRGLRYAVDNPEHAGKVMHAAVPTADPGITAETMALMKPYINGGGLTQSRVMRGVAVLEAAGLARAGLTPDRVVDFSLAPAAA
jgi:NitT/TauT family transport system substrate-binding protein